MDRRIYAYDLTQQVDPVVRLLEDRTRVSWLCTIVQFMLIEKKKTKKIYKEEKDFTTNLLIVTGGRLVGEIRPKMMLPDICPRFD